MYLYIIYSKLSDKYYTGITFNPDSRLLKHNSHSYKGSFTKTANDWEYRLTYKCKCEERARHLEKFIKRMKSRKFIEKIIGNPGILEDL